MKESRNINEVYFMSVFLFSDLVALSPSATSEELSSVLIGFSFVNVFMKHSSRSSRRRLLRQGKGVASPVTCVYRSGWNE